MSPAYSTEDRKLVAKLVDRVFERLEATPPNVIDELRNAPDFQSSGRTISEVIGLIVAHIEATVNDNNDGARFAIEAWLLKQDTSDKSWTNGTPKQTVKRRNLIYVRLGLTPEQQNVINENFPAFVKIAVEHFDGWVDWWSEERKAADAYYSTSLMAYLRDHSGWSKANLAKLDRETDDIVKNIADPAWSAHGVNPARIYSSRGLVVGYVQSGKTTTMNMTIAKAIDHGYKLIIVLAGTTDLLRSQTQRRLDKEVVGQEFLKEDVDVIAKPGEGGASGGYMHDPDWKEFIVHPDPAPGKEPRLIERLTNQRHDFTKPVGAAAFTQAYLTDRRTCKVIVIKKQVNRLRALKKAIAAIPEEQRKRLSTLLLDDESDQAAAVNTRKPDAQGDQELAGVHLEVVELLKLLDNMQYVGLTATPAANCFISPEAVWNLYPKDFILVLDRPTGYMGILDFHDIDEKELEPVPVEKGQPKKDQHVRDIKKPQGQDEEELRRCIDSFVVAGALKLYRASRQDGYKAAKHHTLFFSDSTKKADHQSARLRIKKMWDESAFASIDGRARLKLLYQEDFVTNSAHKTEVNYFPPKFEDLLTHLSDAVKKIDEEFDGHEVVIVVNGDTLGTDPDFQARSIWKIVIGGLKLSRGYTIEGLTITYFRRKSLDASALMQMGRWFGYRSGYQDLVRLFISRSEPAKPVPLDVYAIFESICIDEERLRRDFKRWYNSDPRVTPLQLRPLISVSDLRILPAAKDKMWMVRLKTLSFSRYTTEDFTLKADHLKENLDLWLQMLRRTGLKKIQLNGKLQAFCSGIIEHAEMVKHLKALRFSNHNCEDQKETTNAQDKRALFYSFLSDNGRCRIKEWYIILPQQVNNLELWSNVPGCEQFVKHKRSPDLISPPIGIHPRIGPFGNQDNRDPVLTLVGNHGPGEQPKIKPNELSTDLQQRRRDSLGVVILVPTEAIIDVPNEIPLMGFEIYTCYHPIAAAYAHRDSRAD